MRLHLETPPPALGGPSLQLPQLLPEHASQALLQSDQMLPEQTTPQVGATAFATDKPANHRAASSNPVILQTFEDTQSADGQDMRLSEHCFQYLSIIY